MSVPDRKPPEDMTAAERGREYLELEAGNVEDVEHVTDTNVDGRDVAVLKATADGEELWVVAGDTPTNLYPVEPGDDVDDVIDRHVGVMGDLFGDE